MLGGHTLELPAELLEQVELRFADGVRFEMGPAGLGETAEGRALREAQDLRALEDAEDSEVRVERHRWRELRGWVARGPTRAALIVMPDATRVVRLVAPTARLDEVLAGETHRVDRFRFAAPALEHARFGTRGGAVVYDGRVVEPRGVDGHGWVERVRLVDRQ